MGCSKNTCFLKFESAPSSKKRHTFLQGFKFYKIVVFDLSTHVDRPRSCNLIKFCYWEWIPTYKWGYKTCRLIIYTLPTLPNEEGSVAKKAEDDKDWKYRFMTNEFHFVRICVETIGVWGPKGYKFN